jgi:hypothetical protein
MVHNDELYHTFSLCPPYHQTQFVNQHIGDDTAAVAEAARNLLASMLLVPAHTHHSRRVGRDCHCKTFMNHTAMLSGLQVWHCCYAHQCNSACFFSESSCTMQQGVYETVSMLTGWCWQLAARPLHASMQSTVVLQSTALHCTKAKEGAAARSPGRRSSCHFPNSTACHTYLQMH